MAKGQPNKSAFVRNLPFDMAAKDVVAKAKEVGLALSESYVHTIRSAAKRRASKPVRRSREGAPVIEPRGTAGGRAAANAETQLMSLVIEHGMPAVHEMLARIDSKLRTLV